MSVQTVLRKNILNYISNSPLAWKYPPAYFEDMTEKDLLRLVDGTIDNRESRAEEHSYEIIEIDSFLSAKQYEHYAPTWCIFQSEEIFFEETHQGSCHFVFCKRNDADNYDRIAFGPDYPFDNYGMSFMAILLTSGNRLVSVTSRRNWDEDYDYYCCSEQLENALGKDLFNVTINIKPLTILQISDTHNRHRQLENLPFADVIVHCGDFTDMGTEDEVLDFLNWFIVLPHPHKIFVVGNHDLCLWEAEDIEDLPANVHFLQDRGCEIEGVRFFGLAYNHSEALIPYNVDVLVTHEPPAMILDEGNNTHWGNALLRNRVLEIKPRYHLFGHAHASYGTENRDGIIFSNGSSLDNSYTAVRKPKLFRCKYASVILL